MKAVFLASKAILLASLCGGVAAQCLSDAQLVAIAEAAKRGLSTSSGYNATTQGSQGPFHFAFAPANFTHAGVNPSSRYLVPRVGPWREGDLGNDTFWNWGRGQLSAMTSRQAVVVVMCTPPPVLMWSLETAVLKRYDQDGVKLTVGAPISNTENSATMPAARVDAPLVVLMTADRTTEAAVRSAFDGMNVSVATIAVNGTSSLLNYGTSPSDALPLDEFQLCMRVHPSAAQSATAAFQSYLTRRFPILLVEPTFAGADVPLYPVPERPMRHGAGPEAGLDVRRDVLGGAVVQRMLSEGLTLRQRVPFAPVELDKMRCLVDSQYDPYDTGPLVTGCYGTSSDGRYWISQHYSNPDRGDPASLVVVVIGANHAATGTAADNQLLHDTTVAVNPEALEGSAQEYLGGDAEPSDSGLFAYAFAEKCPKAAGSFCATVEPQRGGGMGSLMRLEAYLDNESGTRPSMGLVQPVALVFTGAALYDSMLFGP